MIAGMKRVISFLCILLMLAFLPAPVKSANAQEERYAAAGAYDVTFYQGPDESTALFLIPFSYYVKVLSEGGTYCAVEYLYDSPPFKKVSGYCKKDALTFVGFVPKRPYLLREITVDYVLPSEGAFGSGDFSTVKQTFVYYGMRYRSDGMYYYVCKDGAFGYIAATEEPTFELNTDYLPDPVDKTEPTAKEGGGGLSAVQIVVICIACVAAVAIAFFVLRQGKRRDTKDELSDF